MPVNLKLNTQNKNLNGTVGFDSLSTNDQINAQRASSGFNATFKLKTQYEIAKAMFLGKDEFNSLGDSYENRVSLETLQSRLDVELSKNPLQQNPQKISSLQKQINNINALRDETRPDTNTGIEVEQQGVYNPDFAQNTVNFSYGAVAVDNRGTDIVLGANTPNINYPQNTRRLLSNHPGEEGRGGFGNDPSEGTVSEGKLESIIFAEKYDPV